MCDFPNSLLIAASVAFPMVELEGGGFHLAITNRSEDYQ